MYDAVGALIYVGKARNLRRRLAQYRTTRRTKKDRKRRALVRLAERIEWQVCASELEASLTEIGLIQALRPRRNVAGAFPFLYPFIGIQIDGADTRFCLTTSPQAFAGFELHGAFRSREITGEASSRSCACSGSSDIRRSGARAIVSASRVIHTSTSSADSRATGRSCGRLCYAAPPERRWSNSRCVCSNTTERAPGAQSSTPTSAPWIASSTTRRQHSPKRSRPPGTSATRCRSETATHFSSDIGICTPPRCMARPPAA
jgi:GIY-YIG catalytic domain